MDRFFHEPMGRSFLCFPKVAQPGAGLIVNLYSHCGIHNIVSMVAKGSNERNQYIMRHCGRGSGRKAARLDAADELLTRAKLGHSVRMILEKKKLKQREIGTLLEIKQPEVSNLMNGRYTVFSQERLFGFLNKLDRKVMVHVTRRRKGEALQEVVMA